MLGFSKGTAGLSGQPWRAEGSRASLTLNKEKLPGSHDGAVTWLAAKQLGQWDSEPRSGGLAEALETVPTRPHLLGSLALGLLSTMVILPEPSSLICWMFPKWMSLKKIRLGVPGEVPAR